MVSEEEDGGPTLERDIILFLEPDFGIDRVNY